MTDDHNTDADEAGSYTSPWIVRWVGKPLLILITLASLAWAGDLYRRVGLIFLNEQFYAGMLALGMPALFLIIPATGIRKRLYVPWYDILIAIVMGATSLYIMVQFPVFIMNYGGATTGTLIAATILLIGVAEGLRRTAGTVLLIFLLAFLAFALVGHFIPGRLQGDDVALDRLIPYVTLDPNGIFGIPIHVSTTIVIAFIFFGFLLEPSGGGRFFAEGSTALMGRFRGGSSKIAVVASTLFGSISGSAVSNVIATGSITIPMMRKGGYSKSSAAAIEAVASTGGQLMPPMMGVAAFLMAELLQVDYSEVVLAAIIPAFLYYVALFFMVDLQAIRDGITAVDRKLIPLLIPTLKRGFVFLLPFVVIIVGLFVWHLQPETAALYAALITLPVGFLFGYKDTKLTVGKVVTALTNTGKASLELLMIGCAAGAIMGVLNITGLGFGLTLGLVDLANGNLLVLLVLSAILCIVLGMGLPTTAVYILLATLVAPSIVEMGVSPMAAHMFVFYYGMMSMITPPVAIAAFVAATVAGAPMMQTGWRAVQFGWVAYLIPFLFVYSPSLLLQGSVFEIALTLVTASLGVWVISGVVVGYLGQKLSTFRRVLYLLVGLGLLLPVDASVYAHWINVVAGVCLALIMLSDRAIWRRSISGRKQGSD